MANPNLLQRTDERHTQSFLTKGAKFAGPLLVAIGSILPQVEIALGQDAVLPQSGQTITDTADVTAATAAQDDPGALGEFKITDFTATAVIDTEPPTDYSDVLPLQVGDYPETDENTRPATEFTGTQFFPNSGEEMWLCHDRDREWTDPLYPANAPVLKVWISNGPSCINGDVPIYIKTWDDQNEVNRENDRGYQKVLHPPYWIKDFYDQNNLVLSELGVLSEARKFAEFWEIVRTVIPNGIGDRTLSLDITGYYPFESDPRHNDPREAAAILNMEACAWGPTRVVSDPNPDPYHNPSVPPGRTDEAFFRNERDYDQVLTSLSSTNEASYYSLIHLIRNWRFGHRNEYIIDNEQGLLEQAALEVFLIRRAQLMEYPDINRTLIQAIDSAIIGIQSRRAYELVKNERLLLADPTVRVEDQGVEPTARNVGKGAGLFTEFVFQLYGPRSATAILNEMEPCSSLTDDRRNSFEERMKATNPNYNQRLAKALFLTRAMRDINELPSNEPTKWMVSPVRDALESHQLSFSGTNNPYQRALDSHGFQYLRITETAKNAWVQCSNGPNTLLPDPDAVVLYIDQDGNERQVRCGNGVSLSDLPVRRNPDGRTFDIVIFKGYSDGGITISPQRPAQAMITSMVIHNYAPTDGKTSTSEWDEFEKITTEAIAKQEETFQQELYEAKTPLFTLATGLTTEDAKRRMEENAELNESAIKVSGANIQPQYE